METENRRPLEIRHSRWVQRTAAFLAQTKLSPNMISLLSVGFSAFSLWMFYLAINSSLEWLCLLLAALGIQLRFFCNLMDGMIAVEHRKRSKLGELYNEFPDRISDLFIILGVGAYCWGQPYAVNLTWLTALLSILSAYIRVLGVSLGTPPFFMGPMAAPQRAALMTVVTVLQIFLPSIPVLYFMLYFMSAGLIVTCCRRLIKIHRLLKQTPSHPSE